MKRILGLDLGSNSVGWALLNEQNGKIKNIEDCGVRIFQKSVEEKIPTPKNQKRRESRLARRVIQRRARRKQRLLNYLISHDLLPKSLESRFDTEKQLNALGNPYELRTKGLDEPLAAHEFGRMLLHFVARRGFLSSKKQSAGDLVDDPDTIEYLNSLDQKAVTDKEEGAFKADITEVYKKIQEAGARTLGEYLFKLKAGEVKRNRIHAGGHLRTDRAMYKDELNQIWEIQKSHFNHLPNNFIKQVKEIIFYQRPLKLKKDRVGKCSLETKNYRAAMARLEVQEFRYLQDINNLKPTKAQREILIPYFESHGKIKKNDIKNMLGLKKSAVLDTETKNLNGNITASNIREVLGSKWDNGDKPTQRRLVEDLLSIKKKSALKERLMKHWKFNTEEAVKLCLIEFEPGHSNHSLKAINKLLPYLRKGMIYSDARQAAGYDYEPENFEAKDKLPAPPETSNPIVNKGLHELRRVVNAIIKEYGKPDIVRIEMARDLEMNTARYKEHQKRQSQNQKANEVAQEAFEGLNLGAKYASRDQKIRYRLWQDQDRRCAYSGKSIALNQVFDAATEIDHILPFKKSLDNSYMNKVLCFAAENRYKGDRTPVDTWGSNEERWHQIKRAIGKWDKSLKGKVHRFFQSENDLMERDFISNQLNDTRYISRLAQNYMRELGCDVNITKGFVVSEVRHQWGFNTLINEVNKKDRTSHLHHAIDAVVIAATSRGLYQQAVKEIKQDELKIPAPYENIRSDLEQKLKVIIVSHDVQRKLSGALHEDSGVSYLAIKDKTGKIIKQGTTYRKPLSEELNISNIIDDEVREIVQTHLEKYGNDKKAKKKTVYHKDGKTPIKRVRVWQSKNTAKSKIEKTKFGVKDQSGKIFKYMAYGNNHHVEIIRHKETKKIEGRFVTTMEAKRRAMTNTKDSKKRSIEPEAVIQENHGEDWEFLFALYKNDLVSVKNEKGERIYYRIQKLNGYPINSIILRLHTASTLKNKEEEIYLGINAQNFKNLKRHQINAIGKII